MAPAAAAAAPKLTHDAPLFQLDFAVNKDTSLQVLKRRQKVLAEFRHCLVCERPCQKKTNSGWEIVGDKHTAVPSSGRGWERYPSCEDQTLTAEEVIKTKQVKALSGPESGFLRSCSLGKAPTTAWSWPGPGAGADGASSFCAGI